MTDTVDKVTRSRIMSSVQSKNTKLELEVRHRLFAMGFRYRLHVNKLPGTPDLVFPKYRSIVFIHGCFWHYHGCHLSSIPKTRSSWWKKKLEDNAKRDSAVLFELQELGWRVLLIWECGFRKPKIKRSEALDAISLRAAGFLNSRHKFFEIPHLKNSNRFKIGIRQAK